MAQPWPGGMKIPVQMDERITSHLTWVKASLLLARWAEKALNHWLLNQPSTYFSWQKSNYMKCFCFFWNWTRVGHKLVNFWDPFGSSFFSSVVGTLLVQSKIQHQCVGYRWSCFSPKNFRVISQFPHFPSSPFWDPLMIFGVFPNPDNCSPISPSQLLGHRTSWTPFGQSTSFKRQRRSMWWKTVIQQLGHFTGWWLQIFFIFNPIWGRFPFWLIFFRWVETTN